MYISKNSESPIANDSTCLVESLSASANHTTIRIWHIANPQNMYTGLMNSQGVVATWNQDYNTSLLTNSDLLSPLASALGVGESGYLSQNQSLTLDRGTVWCFCKSAAKVLFFLKPGYAEQYTVVLSPNQAHTTEVSIEFNSSDQTTMVTNLKPGNLMYKRVL